MERGYEVQTTQDKVYLYRPDGQLVARLCKVSAEYLIDDGWFMKEKATFEDFSQTCAEKFRVQLTEKDRPTSFQSGGRQKIKVSF